MIIRNQESIEFDIFRKPTNTMNYIPSDSSHNVQHKSAAFICMIYRLLLVPLNDENYKIEYDRIKLIAKKNGYKAEIIDNMIKNAKKKIDLRQTTTLSSSFESEFLWRLPLNYQPKLNYDIKKLLKQSDINVVNRNPNKLKNLLTGTKDKLQKTQRAGIYEIQCEDCDEKYIGQTSRPMLVRIKEHQASTRKDEAYKSAVARHMIENQHSFQTKNAKLVKEVKNWTHLDAMETYFMKTTKNLMNIDNPPINSFLFDRYGTPD